MTSNFYVEAHWDAQASVWFSESNIPGLTIEADTLEVFESLMAELAPQMLAANVYKLDENTPIPDTPVTFRVVHERVLSAA